MINRLCLFAVVAAFLNVGEAFQASNACQRRLRPQALNSAPVLEDLATTEGSIGTRSLPPLLRDMADERREFEMNLGKAMDTLRKDYPDMLHKTPEFSIFHDDISVVDPSGVQLSGIQNYKNSFSFLQTIVRFFYSKPGSYVQSRMVYDFARQSIRISWNAVLVPKVVGNKKNALYVDGISIYKMDSKSGKIVEHKVENMLINNIPVRPPYGILSTLREELLQTGQRIPVGVGAMIDIN
eukprot:scaffold259_cov226-Chaetoceros_neogracile.AAC.4